jgi:hypothetical protein
MVMPKKRAKPTPAAQTPEAQASTRVPSRAAGLREQILQQLVGFVAAPVIGVLAGFLLLFGGIFLAIAWLIGPQQLVDSWRYRPYAARVSGHVVESWAALEFDPAAVPAGKLYWQPYAKIQPCVVVDYAGDWGDNRRAFCGNRFTFSDSFRLDDWHTMAPDVPFDFPRDASGFAVPEIRMGKTAMNWLTSHPPNDTFMSPKPPPTTALAALQDQFDRPLDVAVASWTTRVPDFPLLYDPQHADEALPAGVVEARRNGFQPVGLFFVLVFGAIGFRVWQLGVGFLTGQSGTLLWFLSLAPLLALPSWSEVLPQIVRYANKDWADVVTGMLDDINRVTRFTASTPADALLSGGERVQWKASEGRYADTFGRMHFVLPQAPPASADAARVAFGMQVSTQVRQFDSATKAVLFTRLRELYEGNARDVQAIFRNAAEDTLRDASANGGAHKAARNFLIFGSGATYYDDQLDKIEAQPR